MMFDGFERRVRRGGDLGPQPQEGQQILDRALQLGAVSPATARVRADLDVRRDANWSEIVALGYLREAEGQRYYLAYSDGSADRAIAFSSPFPRVVLVALAGMFIVAFILRRMGVM